MRKKLVSIGIALIATCIAVILSLLPVQVKVTTGGYVSFETSYVSAATESLYPTGQLEIDNFTGSYEDIDDDPDSPDSNWLVADNLAFDSYIRVSFDTPSGNPTGTQQVRLWVRRQYTGSPLTPFVAVALYEDGVSRGWIKGATAVTNDTGILVTGDWTAESYIQTSDGSLVEFYIFSNKESSGPNKASVDIGAVEWVVNYSDATADISNSPSSKAFGIVATSTTYWSNGSAPSFPLTDGDAYFTITNNGDQCSITIASTNFTGGVGWTLGTPAENVVRLTAFKEGDGSGDGKVLTTSPQAFISGLTTNIDWELKMETPTSTTDGAEKTATITLAATLD